MSNQQTSQLETMTESAPECVMLDKHNRYYYLSHDAPISKDGRSFEPDPTKRVFFRHNAKDPKAQVNYQITGRVDYTQLEGKVLAVAKERGFSAAYLSESSVPKRYGPGSRQYEKTNITYQLGSYSMWPTRKTI